MNQTTQITILMGVIFSCLLADSWGAGWVRHTIDRSSRGADGVRLGDVNGDGLEDIVTGWEEGGLVRVYLNPGSQKAKQTWPAVTVGKVKSPEDAVFADLDGDGVLDVVSCCEGGTRSIFVHWAPKDRAKLLDASAWKTEAFPAAAGKEMWMYAVPTQVDGRNGIDLVVGSKGGNGSLSWLEAPENPRDLGGWKLHRLRDAGWIMSIELDDVNGDRREDIVFSDRKGARRGAFWLERPEEVAGEWSEHPIGSLEKEVMFLRVGDFDGDSESDVVVTTRNGHLDIHSKRVVSGEISWSTEKVSLPFDLPHGKSVALMDVDGDSRKDIVTTNRGSGEVRCVAWQGKNAVDGEWKAHDIGGTDGRKFDLLEAIDLDGDGDLDLLTCEEADNLGVVWYENPKI